ncbi:MAG: hypothetical protein ABI781_15485, partial [Burkholderiales bacterium]
AAAETCLHDGTRDRSVVTLQGKVDQEQLGMADGSVRTVWILVTSTPTCVQDPGEPRTMVKRVQVFGDPPPTEVPIELTGRLSTGNFSQSYAAPNALWVTKGRKLPTVPVVVTPLPKADIEFNAGDWMQREQYGRLMAETRGCLREYVESRLLLGSRNSKEIVDAATNTCGGALEKNPTIVAMASTAKDPASMARQLVRALAYQQLNAVPGKR